MPYSLRAKWPLLAGLAVIYFIAGYAGLRLNAIEGFASLVWFPTGIALASVFLFGRWVVPALFIGAFSINALFGAPWYLALIIGVGNSAEAVVAAAVLKRLGFDRLRLNLPDIGHYVLAALFIAPPVSSALGVGGMWLFGLSSSPLKTFFLWWLGDAMGALTLGFAILVWSGWRQRVHFRVADGLEVVALGALSLAMLTWLFFLRGHVLSALPASYFFVPLVIWCAVRFGHLGVTLQILLLVAVGTWGTLQGGGLFKTVSGGGSLAYFQIYIFTSSLLGLVVASIFRERDQALVALKAANDSLDRKVKERTSELEEAQHIAKIGSWQWDIATNQVTWSDELFRIHGLEPGGAAMDYEAYLARIHPDDRHSVSLLVDRVLAGDDGFTGRRRIIREDGEVRTMQARGRGVRNAEGKVLKIMGATQDITELMESERELRALSRELESRVQERTKRLEEADRAKDDFLAVLSHELTTPLNVILGWTEVLADETLAATIRDEGIQILQRNALVQKNLIDDLLDTSRIIARKLHFEKTELDLHCLLPDVVKTAAVEAQKKNLKMTFDGGSQEVWVYADGPRIHQVVSNLLSNAIKFSAPGGRIEVRLRVERGRAVVSVRDEGTGIDPDFLDLVFDRFRQESRGTNRQHEGLGLGLAISQYLVHGHDGKIWAESDGKGRGARFTFEIPVLPNSSVSPPATIPEAAVQHLSGKRVLLVDDAPDILDLLSFWLKKYSIEVTTAGSVREAFATLESQRPDMVFCDIGMPAEDGYAFISRLRGHSDPELRTLPVAALTAYTEESERLRALASGFSRHLIKPVTLTCLISVMNEIFPAKATHEAPEKFN